MDVVTGDTYQRDVIDASHHLPVLVDVWGPRCGPCLKMMPAVERLAEEHAASLRTVKLDSSQYRRLCVDLGVMGLPTFLLYRDGREVQRVSGDQCTPASIKLMIIEAEQGSAADRLKPPT